MVHMSTTSMLLMYDTVIWCITTLQHMYMKSLEDGEEFNFK